VKRRIILSIGSSALFLTMMAATGWVLLNPVSAKAASCTADCGNGKKVTCTGTHCGAIDGDKCWSSDGTEIRDEPCRGYGDMELQ
jgi:hypothetical protein